MFNAKIELAKLETPNRVDIVTVGFLHEHLSHIFVKACQVRKA